MRDEPSPTGTEASSSGDYGVLRDIRVRRLRGTADVGSLPVEHALQQVVERPQDDALRASGAGVAAGANGSPHLL